MILSFALIFQNHIPCFPGGSRATFCDEMDAFDVLANCLKRRVYVYFWHLSDFRKCVALFKKSFQGMWTLYVSDMP